MKKPERKTGGRKTDSGFTMESVKRIIMGACLDGRFCEVRSWKTHAGEDSEFPFEAVALVDGRTMWNELCRQHGQFCSLRTFYNHLPGFYVERKKERCVCKRCKKGRTYLDTIQLVVRVLRDTFKHGDENARAEKVLQFIRLKLVELRGHLDKEFVLEIVDKRHDDDDCEKCGQLDGIPEMFREVFSMLGRRQIRISARDWALLFPGAELFDSAEERADALLKHVELWTERTTPYVEHLRLKADRIGALEADIAFLDQQRDAEVWFTDYAMNIKLNGKADETEEDFLCKDVANCLGFMRVYWDNDQLWREYWDFIFQGSKDLQVTLQIQLLLHQIVQEHRQKSGLQPLRTLKIWGDNASDFKGGDMWDQWQKQLRDNKQAETEEFDGLQCVELKYHAAGEGKTVLDGHFGHLGTVRRKRERAGMDRNNVADLLAAMQGIEATHVVEVRLDTENENRFYATAKDIKRFREVQVSSNGVKGRVDARAEMEDIALDIVRERKTKRGQHKKAKMTANLELSLSVQLCQKCMHGVKKGEDLAVWIQCKNCDRSWHKTCVGIAANVPTEDVEWKLCRNCGGNDPKGETLEKRRKAHTCAVCGDVMVNKDHSQCRQQRQQEVDAFRTPVAQIVSRIDPVVSRIPKSRSDEKRKTKKKRKRRAKKDRMVKTDLRTAFGEHL
jgi:hypothetical protein